MKLYVNVGDGKPLSSDVTALIKKCGFHGLRRDVPTVEAVKPLAEEMAREKWHPIFLIGSGTTGKMATAEGPLSPDHIAQLADATAKAALEAGLFDRDPPAAFEIGNEPEIAHGYYAVDPSRFAQAVRRAYDAIHAVSPSAIVITGGTFRTDRNALGYIDAAIKAGIPPACHIGYHTYRQDASPETPYKGFRSRSDEFAALRKIVGERPMWCTESGWHTAPNKKYKRIGIFRIPVGSFRYSDAEVADYIRQEIEINARNGARGYVLYQINDGPNRDAGLDNFGIRTYGGSAKPVAETVSSIAANYA